MDPKKAQVIIEWPTPKNVTGVRRFLGAVGYLQRFIRGYAHIVSPLIDLTKKDAFVWNPTVEGAFQELKVAMITTLVLVNLDFS